MFDQSNYGHNERILPRPLPASYTDSDQVKNDEKDQEENEDAANDEVHPSSPLDSLFLHANPQIYCTCKIEHLFFIYFDKACVFLKYPSRASLFC
jgi:hypothetical protein